MKSIKSALSFILAIILTFSCVAFTATAEGSLQESDALTVKMMNYNVAGLPKLGSADGNGNTARIADYINENNFDIVAVQEDFSYHNALVDNLNGYNYQTNYSGNIPGGDGLNIFTQDMPVYNEERIQWNDSFGDIYEGDQLTAKGILHSVIHIGEGIYIDFYNIHADAFDTSGSVLARESNFRQVMAIIDENHVKYNRPVIITGDFNHSLHYEPELNAQMYSIFHETSGFRDAWIELHNNGDYYDFSEWEKTGVNHWGEWDSVEKFLYRNGGGVEIEAVNFEYNWIFTDSGESVSDHASAECTFKFTKTDEFIQMDQDIEVVKQGSLRNLFNMIKWIFKDLFYIIFNLDELFEMIFMYT